MMGEWLNKQWFILGAVLMLHGLACTELFAMVNAVDVSTTKGFDAVPPVITTFLVPTQACRRGSGCLSL